MQGLFFQNLVILLILAVFHEPFSTLNNCNEVLAIKAVIFENFLPSCFVVAQLALLPFRIFSVLSGDFFPFSVSYKWLNLAKKKIDDKGFIGRHALLTVFVCLQNAHTRPLCFE